MRFFCFLIFLRFCFGFALVVTIVCRVVVLVFVVVLVLVVLLKSVIFASNLGSKSTSGGICCPCDAEYDNTTTSRAPPYTQDG